jgi:hypothetical protein
MITDVKAFFASIEIFEKTLRTAATERDSRRERHPESGEPAWVAFERTQMTAEVNRQRVARGLPPILGAAVTFIEQGASGHIDYAKKYALGCAEIVFEQRDPRTGVPW